MNIPDNPSCKHCGGSVERVTTTDNHTALSDSCYGCRNRWADARDNLRDACVLLNSAIDQLQQYDEDTTGLLMGDEGVRISVELDVLKKQVERNWRSE